MGKKVTKRINDDYGTHIYINKVGLRFNGDVELKGIYIEDYKQDTLIGIEALNTSIRNYRNLYNNKLTFGDIDVIGLTFNIRTYLGEDQTNLDVFVARFEEDNPRPDKSGFLLSSSDVSIYGSTFRMINDNKETPKVLEFNNLNLNATNFLINGSDVSARINTLTFRDSRGLTIKNMVTEFEYTLDHMTFANLSIKTPKSFLNGDLTFKYNREELQDFTNKVEVVASFKDSDVMLNELNTFYNEFGVEDHAKFSVSLSGTLNDLTMMNLRLNTSSQTKVYGDINFKNLFNVEPNTFEMDGDFSNLSSNYYDLKSLMPNILGASIPSIFSKLGGFTIYGKTKITSTDIVADLKINTALGHIESDLNLLRFNDIDNASYKGNVVFEEFDLGEIVNDPNIKATTFDLEVNGKGFTLENLNTNIKGHVFNLNYNNYDYKNIDISGQLGNKIFNGDLISHDENLKFKFKGLADMSAKVSALDFTAEVEYANLRALNFVTKDSIAIFKGDIIMDMDGSSIDDAFGTLTFNNTTYINQNDSYFFDDFEITSRFVDKERIVEINSPDIIEGQVSGIFKFKDIGRLVENSIGSIYTNYVPHKVENDQYLDFNFTIYNKIVEVFYHDLELGKNTFVKGRIESDRHGFNLTFKSPKIKLFDYFANDIQVKIDNGNPLFNTFIEIDSINTKFYNVSKFNLINVTVRDTLFIKSEFNGGKNNNDQYNLSLFYTIDEDNKSVVGFKKSEIIIKDNEWVINQQKNQLNKVAFDRSFKEFDISEVVFSHKDEEIQLSGALRDSTYKDIKLRFMDVDLNKVTPTLDSISFGGILNGNLDILQQNGIYVPDSDVSIEKFMFNDYMLGDLRADIVGNQSLTNYTVDLFLRNDNLKSLDITGNIDVSATNSNIDLDVEFREFDLEPLNVFGADVITNIRGLASGDVKVSGDIKKPQIDGQLILDNAGLAIPYLNVDYAFDFDTEVTLKDQRFLFNDVVLTDSEFFSKATLNGFLSHQNFSDWRLGLDIDTNRLLVLNTDDAEDALYYGTAFMNGTASIFGPTDQLVIEVDGSTAQGTVFKIPLNDVESFGDNSYIHFLSPEEKAARLKGETITETQVKGLELKFDLNVNQNADIEIVIDRNSGSTIQGSGEGNLLFEINTNGKFKMWGDFSVFKGIYNFSYGGLIQKNLVVEPGGSIIWEGDALKAQINLKAIYKTEANPSVLLDNPINRSIPVNVEIDLTGQLEQPTPDFNLTFPNASSTVRSELEYRLETKESRENQALFLLATGSFASEISLGQQAYGTIADRVNSLFNDLLSSDDDKLKLGLNFQAGEQTPDYRSDDRLGLTLSTKISDRVLFNGKVGVPIGGVNETVIAGDAEIELLLNEDGTLSAKFFNRENNIRNFGEEIGYTQGVGLSYNVEFDTFRELLRIIFSGKNRKDKKTVETKNVGIREENPLPEYVKMKKKKSKEEN
ncbi:translocation/assembly module TamB domain-containing protein [Gelidibacter japonicus]|uniref:translocation/assembly module TamB domain-containing protein n=1 Tax=Gelidibacter japonicus TaxID=1962232 RepID=UPI00202251E7|nr:translocation/assembly module TamB [Gelidibacter japonicus]MCL8006049.1 translocation/assembly module TamB domain-containing protein [Gelidibacter japonicus]